MWIDLLIILLVASGIYRGWLSGFAQQFWASAGFFSGLLIGRVLSSWTVNWAHSSNSRSVVTLVTFLVCIMLFLTAGEYLGLRTKHVLRRYRLNKLDNGLGSLMSVVAAFFGIWLLASLATSLPYDSLQTTIKNSRIISGLNRVLPPAPNIVASLGKLIDPNGFPDVFIGAEPTPKSNVDLPALGDFAAVVDNDKASVVRIKGQGCGGIVSGSGFVVEPGLVATNAHVVAGIASPYIQDANGNRKGTVVRFDSDLDFALIRTTNLAGPPLAISSAKIAGKTPAAVLGYPGGGDFNAGPAAVLDQIRASGRNIYGTGHTLRDVYEVHATIVPGNSGGPLIAQDGSVIGVIFAESTEYDHVGYALTTSKVSAEIKQAEGLTEPVSTSRCAE